MKLGSLWEPRCKGFSDMGEWNSVKDRLPEYDETPGSLGVEVDVKGENLQEDFAFYGVRITVNPRFYLYGELVSGVTHWRYRT